MAIVPLSLTLFLFFLCFSIIPLALTISSTRSSSAAAIVVVLPRPLFPLEPRIPLKVPSKLRRVGGGGPATFTVAVTQPKGCVLGVQPTALHFSDKDVELSYTLTVYPQKAGREPQVAGKLTWTDEDAAVVTVPVVVKWME